MTFSQLVIINRLTSNVQSQKLKVLILNGVFKDALRKNWPPVDLYCDQVGGSTPLDQLIAASVG